MEIRIVSGLTNHQTEEEAVDNPSEVFVVIVTVVSLVIIFGTPILIFYLFYLAKRRKLETIIKLVELGGDLKPEMLAMLETDSGPTGDLRKGLIWLAIGIPITLGILFVFGFSQSIFGLIPILIGVAYLIVMKHGREENKGGSHGL